jgi:hydrogenase maturation protease
MALNRATPRIVIIGVGNLLLKDEGIGIHIIRALDNMELPPDIKLIDGGIAPDLISCIEHGDKLIIIDAAKGTGEPGSIYRLKPQDLSQETGQITSAHDLGVERSLRLLSLTNSSPEEVIIIGIEPEEIEWGLELSPRLKTKFPEILQAVLGEIGVSIEISHN